MVETTSGTYTIAKVTYWPQKAWRAYGVFAEDGGLSYQTYASIDEAKRDPLYRGRAKIVRLRIENMCVEEERQPTPTELFMRELLDAQGT